jgi:hypothetical protein
MSVLLCTRLVCLAAFAVRYTCQVFACHCDSIPTNHTWPRSPLDIPVNTDGLYSKQKSCVCLSSIYELWYHNSPIVMTS